jgi:hypothetical protein
MVRNIMKHLPVHLFSCVVAAVLIPLLLTTAVAQAQAAPWTVVKSPNPGAGNGLFGVASISANDVWAVGDSSTSGVEQALIEQWNGTSWSVVSSPTAGTSNDLRGVAIISANDIWAVGTVVISNFTQTLIEQWNGTSWNVVPSPSPSSTTNLLEGATADQSSGQAWAVGQFTAASGAEQTLTEFNP